MTTGEVTGLSSGDGANDFAAHFTDGETKAPPARCCDSPNDVIR